MHSEHNSMQYVVGTLFFSITLFVLTNKNVSLLFCFIYIKGNTSNLRTKKNFEHLKRNQLCRY